MEKFKLSLPASLTFTGDIIITDPCYFIPKLIWEELWDAWFTPDGLATKYAEKGIIEFKDDIKVLYSSTAYGDGEYSIYLNRGNGESVHDNTINVDSGMMAVILVEDVQKLNPKFNIDDTIHPRINDFDGLIKANGDGDFVGDIQINTQEEPELYSIDEYDEYDDDSDAYYNFEDED